MTLSTDAVPKPGTRMTLKEFRSLNLPETSDLFLLDGVVLGTEGGGDMTRRNQHHARIELRVGRFLDQWVDESGFQGAVYSGEVGCDLSSESSVGIDVAVFSVETVKQSEGQAFISGVPVLAVEVLSPNDREEDIDAKIDSYLMHGVSLIWIINPKRKTILIFRSDEEPELVTVSQVLTGHGVLPNFEIEAKLLFE